MRRFVFLLFVLLLAACAKNNPNPNSNPNPDPDGDGLVSTGQIGVLLMLDGHMNIEVQEGLPAVELTATYAFANFQAFPQNQDLPLDPLGQMFDTCFVQPASSALTTQQLPEMPELPEFPDLPTLPLGEGLTPISAGGEVSVKDGPNLYTTLLKQTNGYYLAETMSKKVPEGLSVSIPGQDFPAFTTALPQNVSKFHLSSPADKSAIHSATTFSWASDGSKDTFVLLIGSSSSGSRFSCYATDDGSFSFPSDSLMAEAGFTGKLESAARIRYESEYKGDSLFMPMHGSLEMYPDTSVIP